MKLYYLNSYLFMTFGKHYEYRQLFRLSLLSPSPIWIQSESFRSEPCEMKSYILGAQTYKFVDKI